MTPKQGIPSPDLCLRLTFPDAFLTTPFNGVVKRGYLGACALQQISNTYGVLYIRKIYVSISYSVVKKFHRAARHSIYES